MEEIYFITTNFGYGNVGVEEDRAEPRRHSSGNEDDDKADESHRGTQTLKLSI